MKSKFEKLGNYIRPVDERNCDLAITNLQGVSITKEFVPSIANIIGTDLSTYKIVRTGQFAYGAVTSRNGDKISIALLKGEDCIISSSYVPFEVYRKNELLPEYLMLWFMRPEFDRYARFMSNGSAREVFDWECMCDVELPIPPITEQRKTVHDFQVITDRIELLRKINENLEKILKHVFYTIFFEDNSVSYSLNKLSDITDTIDNRGKTPPNDDLETAYPLIEIASLHTEGRITTYRNCTKYVTKDIYDNWFRSGHPKQKDILMSTVGSLAELKLFWGTKGSIAQNIVAFRCHNKNMSMYLFQYLLEKQNELMAYEIGSVQASIKVSQVINYQIPIPPETFLQKYDLIATKLTELIYANEEEKAICYHVIDFLLQRLS